jgi:hypothetical protein
MSDYAAIVHRDDFSYRIAGTGTKPYWATNSADGRYCFVSFSGDDAVGVFDYASEREVARIPVGDHPQRMRMGLVRTSDIKGLPHVAQRPPRAHAKLRILRARVRGGKLDIRLGITARATGRVRAIYRSAGKTRRFSLKIPQRGAKPRTWTVRRDIATRRRTGIVTLRYAGSARVRPDELRARVATRRAKLRQLEATMSADGRLTVRGSVNRTVPGVVRLRLDPDDESGSLAYRARIRGGRWTVRALVPAKVRGGQVSIQYTGNLARRIRGEALSKRVAR